MSSSFRLKTALRRMPRCTALNSSRGFPSGELLITVNSSQKFVRRDHNEEICEQTLVSKLPSDEGEKNVCADPGEWASNAILRIDSYLLIPLDAA